MTTQVPPGQHLDVKNTPGEKGMPFLDAMASFIEDGNEAGSASNGETYIEIGSYRQRSESITGSTVIVAPENDILGTFRRPEMGES